MNKTILVTSGATIEKIDEVRSISNFSTGRLGSLIAEHFSDDSVIYVCGQNAFMPQTNAEIIKITSAEDLLQTCKTILYGRKIDAVIHAMAVSDFCVGSVEDSNGNRLTDSKISSSLNEIVVRLRRNPKIISIFKELAPESILIGFKLLSNVTVAKLFCVAQSLLNKNHCDYVVANLLEDIGEKHTAYLLNANGVVGKFNTKLEIAEGVYKNVQKHFTGG
jgi:phosphopantothenate-cysteine ligase